MSLAIRKTFSSNRSPQPAVHAVERPSPSHSHSLPSYAAASSSPSRGYFGPAPEVRREHARSNKAPLVAAEAPVLRRTHLGAGAVGTSPPLPPIPLPPPLTITYDRGSQSTFKPTTTPPCDGLGIALDLGTRPQVREASPPRFTVLANVSHIAPGPTQSSVPAVGFEHSRDRLARTRASISAPSSTENRATLSSRGANRVGDVSKCYTVASFPAHEASVLSRPPKSALRATTATTSLPPPPPAPVAAPAWTGRSAPATRSHSLFVTPSSDAAPSAQLAGYCLRPTVSMATQTPASWNYERRRSSHVAAGASTPPQAYSSFTDMFGGPQGATGAGRPRSNSVAAPAVVPPSPSVYSIASGAGVNDTPRQQQHRKGSESFSSFYAFKLSSPVDDDLREEGGGDEYSLEDAIDRHLGELTLEQQQQAPSVQVEEEQGRHGGAVFDVPFLDPSPYDTPLLRPFELPPTPTPLAIAAAASSTSTMVGGLSAASPMLSQSAVSTPTFDRTPTLPPRSSHSVTEIPSSPTPSSSSSSSRSTRKEEGDGSEASTTPPTSAASSATFEDVASIHLAEQEPIQIRKASLVSACGGGGGTSSRKSSLVNGFCGATSEFQRRQSLHSRRSSASAKSVKFDLGDSSDLDSGGVNHGLEPEEQERSGASGSGDDDDEVERDSKHFVFAHLAAGRRRSESDKPIVRARTGTTMTREERAQRGRSYFLVQALMGEEIPREGMIRDWARDTEDERSDEEDDDRSIVESEWA